MSTARVTGEGAESSPVISPVLAILLALGITVVASLYLELLGWRILQPQLTLSDAWSRSFLLGGLRTSGGAITTGLFFMVLALAMPRWRTRDPMRHFVRWCAGTLVFLLAMAGLIAWAP